MALWEEFAAGLGRDPGDGRRRALTETQACVEAWLAGEDLLEHLAVLYAIEASQPEISRTKLEGLTAHYGYSAEGPATEYFSVHELRDVEHARQAGELIAELMAGRSEDPEEQAERMVRRAKRRCAATGRCSTACGASRPACRRSLTPAARRTRRQAPGEQDGGHGGRQVEARDARAHRDADARRRAASSSALSPWRSVPKASTARGSSAAGSSGSPSGSSASSGRSSAVERLEVRQAGDGQGVVQPGGAAQRVGVPRVVAAGGEHAGRVGGRGGDAHAGAHVAEVARVLEQDHRRAPPVGEHGRGVDRGALGQRDHAGRGRQRRELLGRPPASTLARHASMLGDIRREPRGEPVELGVSR